MTETGFEATTTQFVNNFCFNSWYHLLINRISVKKTQIVAKLYQMCHIISLVSQICHQYSNCYYPENEYIASCSRTIFYEWKNRIGFTQISYRQHKGRVLLCSKLQHHFFFNSTFTCILETSWGCFLAYLSITVFFLALIAIASLVTGERRLVLTRIFFFHLFVELFRLSMSLRS